MDYSIIDIIFGILLLIGGIMGYRKGFFKELLALLGVFIAVWAAISFSDNVVQFFTNNWGWDTTPAFAVAFIIIFIFVMLIAKFIAIILTKMANFLMLGFINRLFGMALGICKMAIILSIFANALSYVDKNDRVLSKESKDEALTYRPIEGVMPTVMPFIKSNKYVQENLS